LLVQILSGRATGNLARRPVLCFADNLVSLDDAECIGIASDRIQLEPCQRHVRLSSGEDALLVYTGFNAIPLVENYSVLLAVVG